MTKHGLSSEEYQLLTRALGILKKNPEAAAAWHAKLSEMVNPQPADPAASKENPGTADTPDKDADPGWTDWEPLPGGRGVTRETLPLAPDVPWR